MKLYEIDQQILECVDLETGEVVDIERLESLQMERDSQIEGVTLWVKELRADEAAITAEIKALVERREILRNKQERLKKWLTEATGGKRFTTARCDLQFRRTHAVHITDEALLPGWAWVVPPPEISKTAIRNAFKQGEDVPGAEMAENVSLTIK